MRVFNCLIGRLHVVSVYNLGNLIQHILLCRVPYWIRPLYSVNPDCVSFRLPYAFTLSNTITVRSNGRYRMEK